MRKSANLISALFPEARRLILARLLMEPEKWWYLSDLAKHLQKSPSSLQRELDSLVSVGILERRTESNRVYHRVDSACPILKELQGLFLKTTGLIDVMIQGIQAFDDDIEVAFVFGSIAKGEEISESDVDLMIIGNLGLAELAPKLKEVEKTLLREVNPVTYTAQEFRSRFDANDHFLATVLREEKLFLKGSDEHLGRLTSE